MTPPSPKSNIKWDTDRWFAVATLTMLFSGVLAIIVYGSQYSKSAALSVISSGFMIAGASLVVGGLLGFLFGIPRTPEKVNDSEDGPHYSANTNLEQISDWLTKILVGVGLTQLPAIRKALHGLVQFLGPALGAHPDSPVLAFLIFMYFITSGFVLGYLWTRILLPAQFRAADLAGLQMRLEKAEKATEDVRKTVEEQAKIDAHALTAVSALLNPTPGSIPPSQEELNDAIANSSPAIRVQVFNQAQEQRMDNWRAPDNVPKMERTIPVFRALIAADKENRFDRNHAQLGYALKDKQQPDWAEAESELSKAIEIRGKTVVKGFLFYEFNRALCRIMQDAEFVAGKQSNQESKERILNDLRLVAKAGLSGVLRDPTIVKFLAVNEVLLSDLAK